MEANSLCNIVEETLYTTRKSIDVDHEVDNSSAMTLALDPTFSRRTRHNELRWHYVREQDTKNKIKLHKVKTEDSAADLLTKTTKADQFSTYGKFIGLMDADKSDTRNGLLH
uniref:Copia protein n=1 Tax=Peronospora matthiolae TaxID=2874970 RepID=A0AAV1T7E0_9STRA